MCYEPARALRPSETINIRTKPLFSCLVPQGGPQSDRETEAGQDEQLHRRAGIIGAHLQRHVQETGQADGPAHGRAAHEDLTG